MLAELGEQCFRLVIGNTWVDNYIFTLLPVHGGGYAVLIADLQSYGQSIMINGNLC